MAHAPSDAPLPKVTEEAFLADRMGFWDAFNRFTVRSTASLILFSAWLWWASATGFTLLHSLALPVGVAACFILL